MSLVSLATLISYGIWKNRQLNQALGEAVQAQAQAENNVRRAINSSVRRITHLNDATANPLPDELAFLEQIRTRPGQRPKVRTKRALAARWAGFIYSQLNDPVATQKAFGDSIAESSNLIEQFPRERSYRNKLANAVAEYGAALARFGDKKGAKREYKRAIEILESLLKEDPNDADVRFLLSGEYNNLGAVSGELGGDAEPFYRKALALREKLVGIPRQPRLSK